MVPRGVYAVLWLALLAVAHAAPLAAMGAQGVPVNVMLSLDTVSNDGTLNNPTQLEANLRALVAHGAKGFMTDVWWGVVEAAGPKQYKWDAYVQLAELVKRVGAELHVVMSFHACGGNVGDACNIPLPPWVTAVGEKNKGIFFTDQNNQIDEEYLSFGVDHEALFEGRTAVEMYNDYMYSFSSAFGKYLGSTITEVEVGLGPAGEARYPSYTPGRGWAFPGIGAFQCYDTYLLAQMRTAACAAGNCAWGNSPPTDVGGYNTQPASSGFFKDGGTYATAYGKFFLGWYRDVLFTHMGDVLEKAQSVFAPFPNVQVTAKIAGIHWWYQTASHAAECTAGYYNTNQNDFYREVAQLMHKYDVAFDFTCMELYDKDQHGCGCGPQELVAQARGAAQGVGTPFYGENALGVHANWTYFYQNIVKQSFPAGGHPIEGFTLLRIGSALLSGGGENEFQQFCDAMEVGHY